MNVLKAVNLGLRFVLELCLLAALGYWGFTLDQSAWVRAAAGLGTPLLAAATWGTFVAPKAAKRLRDPRRFALELALFGTGAGMLWASGHPSLAILLFVTYFINRSLMVIWGQSHL